MPHALLLILGGLVLAQGPAVAPSFESQAGAAFEKAKEWVIDEDADEESFGIDGEIPLPNFHQVSTGVFRSGQPNREGLARLRSLGVRTILVIREKVGDDETAEARRLGMSIELVAMNGVFSPPYDAVDRALSVLADPAKQPLLVHCRYGKDRTGVTVAAYRTALEAWPVPKAAAEAKSIGCCHTLFRPLAAYLNGYLRHRRGE